MSAQRQVTTEMVQRAWNEANTSVGGGCFWNRLAHELSAEIAKPEQRTVTVYTATGAVELPEPMREAPEKGVLYYLLSNTDEGAIAMTWNNDSMDRRWLAAGECFHTAEHAQAWADFQRMQRVGETK